ncbi:MAG: fused MFS/spermidine synthase [Rhodocyclaceae bacterium]|nr:fused MFS/spermidine synthase [Rhodocyclaceae bacterium]
MTPIDISEQSGVRFLHFGSEWIQGAMRIARPFALELEYTREMMVPLLMYPDDWPKRVLMIGLGAGSLLKFMWRYRAGSRITVVEIDPRMEAAARQFFKLPDNPERISIRVGDGADFMITSRHQYDLILVDGFDADARANRLDSVSFYLNCRARLSADGMLCVNLLSRRKDFGKSLARMQEAFEGHAIAFPSNDVGNAIALATKDHSPEPSVKDLSLAASALRKATGLNLAPQLARISKSNHFPRGTLKI